LDNGKSFAVKKGCGREGLRYPQVGNKKWTDLNNVEEMYGPMRVNSKAIRGAQLFKTFKKMLPVYCRDY